MRLNFHFITVFAVATIASAPALGGNNDMFTPPTAQVPTQKQTPAPPRPKPKPALVHANPTGPRFNIVGTWKISINCGMAASETVVISSASATDIRGTTQNLISSGDIVGGSLSGRDVVLHEVYGSKHKRATWTGELTPSGDMISGNILGLDDGAHCTFSAPMPQ
jgi:hypothetical protein